MVTGTYPALPGKSPHPVRAEAAAGSGHHPDHDRLHHKRVHKQELGADPSCSRGQAVCVQAARQNDVFERPHQKEAEREDVGQEARVDEDLRAEQVLYEHQHQDGDEFVATVADEVPELSVFLVHAQHVERDLDQTDIHQVEGQCSCCGVAEQLWMERAVDPAEDGPQQHIRHKRHQRDVQVGGVDVFYRGGVHLDALRDVCRPQLSCPRFVPEGE
ncbi:hypothetical protein KL909_002926 [Ogataea angusta]|nr:hypothetical protein KL909_002926 [Ogataea angusta]